MITAFEGLPGAGKTLSQTMYAYKYWLQTDIPVFANYSLRFPKPPPYGKGYIQKDGSVIWKPEYYYPKFIPGDRILEALPQFERACILIDEIGSIADNREWKSFPKATLRKFRESRKYQLEIMYTAQSIGDVEIKIRKLTNFLVKCKFEKPLGCDLFLRNWAYHSNVIGNESQINMKEYLAWSETCFPWEFKKYYDMYDTYEHIKYKVEPEKQLDRIIFPNFFEENEEKFILKND